MSFKGAIEAKCPSGCEPFTAEIWSFIRGDAQPELRLLVLFRECNLLLCPDCNKPFFPDAPYIYFDPTAELLAFVLPESYREKEEYWRSKMAADFAVIQDKLGAVMPAATEPEVFFGLDEIAELLQAEDDRADERDVMEFIAKDLGLSLYRVSPFYARRHGVPGSLPFMGEADRNGVLTGLEKILVVNDRLTAYVRYHKYLSAAYTAALPPAALVAVA